MCGISGFVAPQLGLENLQSATRILQHRGPDAEGYFMESLGHLQIGLGHRRLSIIDLSESANQPFYSSDGRYVMVYNGEIYNFRELRKKYQIRTKTKSDTEIIIELFARHGVSTIRELNGMFALVIFDQQEKKIYAFRDRFGVKPFFYYWDGSSFIFGSEIKTILRILRPGPEINVGALRYYLNFGFIPAPFSIYKNIFKLQPGFTLKYEIKDQNFSCFPYVRLSEFVAENTEENPETAVKNVEFLLLKSVERQIISDVPLGIFLSGGTDSSLLAAIAREVSTEKVKTFTLGFSDSLYDEMPYARRIAEYLETDHHEMVVSDHELLRNLDAILRSYDEPYFISAGFSAFALSEFCRRHVTVALSGEGADELFLGYGFYSWARRLNTFPVRPFAQMIYRVLSLSPQSYIRYKAGLFKIPEDSLESHIFTHEQYYFSKDEIAENFAPEISESGFGHLAFEFPSKRSLDPVEKQSWFDLHTYLVDDLLTKIDRASMAYSLEARVPYLDNDLFAYAVNISSRLRMKDGQAKYILKKILEKYIPRELTDRPKWGFAPPLKKWLKKALKPMTEQYLSKKMIEQYSIVHYDFVESLKNKFNSGQEHLFNKIWLLVLLHKWLSEKN